MISKKIKTWLGGALALFLGVATVSCNRGEVDVQEQFSWEIKTLPFRTNLSVGSELEIRGRLDADRHFSGASYTIRYFMYRGDGKLRIGRGGEYMKQNELYLFPSGDFTLRYKAGRSPVQEIEIVIADSFGQSKTLKYVFTAVAKKGSSGAGDDEVDEEDVYYGEEGGADGSGGYGGPGAGGSSTDSRVNNLSPLVYNPDGSLGDLPEIYGSEENLKLHAGDGSPASEGIGSLYDSKWDLQGGSPFTTNLFTLRRKVDLRYPIRIRFETLGRVKDDKQIFCVRYGHVEGDGTMMLYSPRERRFVRVEENTRYVIEEGVTELLYRGEYIPPDVGFIQGFKDFLTGRDRHKEALTPYSRLELFIEDNYHNSRSYAIEFNEKK